MGTSLIPIKGISLAQKRSLKSSCNISDITGLLSGGRTPEQRQIIADKLKIDRRYVDIWVKQAALWDVDGMTEDYAYLLIVAGIRCALDLAKIDIGATKIALKAVSNAHPDHQYDESKLPALKTAAQNLGINSSSTIPVFDENDPEPIHLFAGSQAGANGVSKITVTVTFANGQTYENTTTFPGIQCDGGNISVSSESTSGRVDRPTGKGTYTTPRPSSRVDHPGMTGRSSANDSSSSNTESSGTGNATGRRR
jgi:hypothetical protein